MIMYPYAFRFHDLTGLYPENSLLDIIPEVSIPESTEENMKGLLEAGIDT